MHLRIYLAYILSISSLATALERRSPSRIAVTSHVLPLIAAPHPHPLPPSSQHLRKRRVPRARRQTPDATPSVSTGPIASHQQPLITLGGRVYMTNLTLSSTPYTLILDTGSSDTWLASSSFVCVLRISQRVLPQRVCGFGALYDGHFERVGVPFDVRYTDGEALWGELGIEDVGFGEEGLEVRQTIGVVERGWWMGDGTSSGLVGLGYPSLTSGHDSLNYTSIIFTLFREHGHIDPIFSLALSRPTPGNRSAGGLLAIGGIPDVPHDDAWVSVPIVPYALDTYTYYSIPVDGFTITPPSLSAAPTITLPVTQGGPLHMIIDSGSTLIYLPAPTAEQLASLFDPPARYVPASNTYLASCTAAQPRFGVVIGGRTFYVDPRDMLNGEGGECVVAVQRTEGGDAVLGDAFLKNVLVVFDVGDHSIRIAAREEY